MQAFYFYLIDDVPTLTVFDPPERFHVNQENQLKAESGLKLMIRPLQYYFYYPSSEGTGSIRVLIGLKNVSSKPILVKNVENITDSVRTDYHFDFVYPSKVNTQGFTVDIIPNPPLPGLSYPHKGTYFLSPNPNIKPSFKWLQPGKMQVALFKFSTAEFSLKQPTAIELQMSYSMNSITLQNGIRSWGGTLHSNTIKFQVAPVSSKIRNMS